MYQVVNIQSQTLKRSYIKLIVLLCSLVQFLTAIPFGARNPSLVVFILGVVYLFIAIAYILIRNAKENVKCLKVIWLVDLVYMVAGLLYYVGINFPTPLLKAVLLGTGIIVYWFIFFFISKYYQSKEHQTTEAKLQLVPEWILAAESVTLFVDFDAWYTVMINSFNLTINMTNSDSFCESDGRIIGAWVLWAFFILLYMFVLFYTLNNRCSKCNVNCSCVISNIISVVLLAAFSIYLLINSSILDLCSGEHAVVTSIVLELPVLIVVITVIVLLLVYRCMSRTRQKKLLPRALYQHLHPEPDEHDLPLETVNID